MAAKRREFPAGSMCEPAFPPTMLPGVTIGEWRRRRVRRRPGPEALRSGVGAGSRI
jgi:hypothetical protein